MPMGCQLFTILLVKAQDNRSTFKSDKSSSQDMNRDSRSYDNIESIIDNPTFIER